MLSVRSEALLARANSYKTGEAYDESSFLKVDYREVAS
jgi:hypothetical protein